VDALLFPHYHEEMCFAALTCNDRGLSTTYGTVAIIFKGPMIVLRASVFEENPFTFCQKHNIVAGSALPPGFRADWGQRNQLAKAKLHAELTGATPKSEFAGILLKDSTALGDDDFIEVHIYGGFNSSAIEMVTYKKPTRREDISIYRSFVSKLKKHKIAYKEL
jgi:hypothetical protein